MSPESRWTEIGTGKRRDYLQYRCDCGNVKEVYKYNVRSGASMSCGCLALEVRKRRRGVTHGKSHTPEHGVWADMHRRCRNVINPKYKHWAGRGIKVCERWSGPNGFANFYADMGPRPSSEHSVDRYPNKKGNYEPGNCRWGTEIQQQRNRTNNVEYTYKGKTQCTSAWAADLGIRHFALRLRIKKWGLERALSTPKRHDKVTR